MWIYCLGGGLSILLCKLFNSKEVVRNIYLRALLIALPLFVLSAFRYGVGTDYFNYLRHFREFYQFGIRHGTEFGWYLMNYSISWFGLPEQFIFIISSAIYLIAVFVFLLRVSPNPGCSIFLLVFMGHFFFSMNGVRQAIADAIVCACLPFFLEKKYWQFSLGIFLASLFHTVALIFGLAVVLFDLIRLRRENVLFYTIIWIVSIPISIFLTHSMIAGTHYEMYISYKDLALTSSKILGFLIYVGICILATYFYSNKYYYIFYYRFIVISVWLSILGFTWGTVAGRLKSSFSLPLIVLIPMIIANIENERTRRLCTVFVLLFYISYSFIKSYFGWLHSSTPYQFCF